MIRVLYDVVTERVYPLANPTAGEKLAIVAVGGYGRGEMAPYSDIDLLFLLPYKQTPHTEQVVEYLLYLLWDLGLKVGQATRSVADCLRYAKADLTIRTALLEARYIWGEQALYNELKQRFDPTSRRARAALETCTPSTGSQSTSTASTTSRSSSSLGCCRPRNRRGSSVPRPFYGRCAVTFIISPAAPKSG